MFRFSRLKKMVVVGVLGAFCVWTAASVCEADESAPASQGISDANGRTPAPLGICDEDEYVLLLEENNYVGIYDREGTYLGRCREVLDEYQGALTVKKDALLCYGDGEKCSIFSMAEQKTIQEFSGEHYEWRADGNTVLVTDRSAGTVSLYDNEGLVYCMEVPGITLEEYGDYARVLKLDNGYVIGVESMGEEDDLSVCPVWVGLDGRETKEINDPFLTEMFREGKVSCGLGRYLVISDWETGIYGVYSLDGELLLDGLGTTINPFCGNWDLYGWNSRPAFVTRWEDGLWAVYDSELRFVGTLSSENEYPNSVPGIVEGLAYEELGGRVCTGIVEYNGEDWMPVSRTEDGCLIYAYGELLRIPLSYNEEIISLNDAFMVTLREEDGENYERNLIDRRTGEKLATAVWEENHSIDFSLGKGYCIMEEKQNGERSVKILDNQGRITYASDKTECQTWKNGYIFMKRGVYRGIADIEGNWIARTAGGWTE